MNVAVESMFNTSFCAVPAFMRVVPAMTSGPTSGAIAISTARESSESGRTADADRDGAQAVGFGDRAEHVGRAAAGGDADQHVARGKAAGEEIADADGGIVLGGFGGAAQGGFAAGHDALHHLRRRAEGGRNLGGVEHAETAAGAGADVEEPAAVFDRGDDGVDGASDRRDLALHGDRPPSGPRR